MREGRTAFIYLLPALSLMLLFYLYPMVDLAYLSFFKWNGISAHKEFIGGQNYLQLFSSAEFHNVLYNTLFFSLLTVPLSVVVSLILALLVQKPLSHLSFFRTSLFLPVIISTVGAGLAWKFIYHNDAGILNLWLNKLAFPSVNWLGNEKTAIYSVAVTTIWKNVGYNMILFLAGLNSIPSIYYEAALMDGIQDEWTKFRRITWPLLRPTVLLVTVISVIFSFKSFDQIYVMTSGGPVGSTTVLIYYIFEKGFQHFEMGLAAAVSIIMLIIVLVLTWLQIKVADTVE